MISHKQSFRMLLVMCKCILYEWVWWCLWVVALGRWVAMRLREKSEYTHYKKLDYTSGCTCFKKKNYIAHDSVESPPENRDKQIEPEWLFSACFSSLSNYYYIYCMYCIWDILPETYISTCKNLGFFFLLLLNLNVESYGGHVKLWETHIVPSQHVFMIE